MSAHEFTEAPPPWADGDDRPIPARFVAQWVHTPLADGRIRQRAMLEVHHRLSEWGFSGCALVGGAWMEGEAPVQGVAAGVMRGAPDLWFETAGEVDPSWLEGVVRSALADPERADPGDTPRAFRCDATPPALVVDFSVAGRRAGVGVFVGPTARGAALLKWFVDHPATWWVFLGFGGLLRADRY